MLLSQGYNVGCFCFHCKRFSFFIKSMQRIMGCKTFVRMLLHEDKTLGRALDPRANGTWLSKLTE